MKSSPPTLAAVLSPASAALAENAPAQKVLILKNKAGAAILGYDPVAYFTDGKPAQGNPKVKSTYQGADY